MVDACLLEHASELPDFLEEIDGEWTRVQIAEETVERTAATWRDAGVQLQAASRRGERTNGGRARGLPAVVLAASWPGDQQCSPERLLFRYQPGHGQLPHVLQMALPGSSVLQRVLELLEHYLCPLPIPVKNASLSGDRGAAIRVAAIASATRVDELL
jgi:hypothetical protein